MDRFFVLFDDFVESEDYNTRDTEKRKQSAICYNRFISALAPLCHGYLFL